MRRTFWFVAVTVALIGVLFVGVFPTRTYLAQRRSIAAAEERVAVLGEHNQRLAARVKQLHTDAEIERLAREQYNLVRPGEEAFAILPAPGEQQPEARPGPKPPPKQEEAGALAQLWDTLTFWD